MKPTYIEGFVAVSMEEFTEDVVKGTPWAEKTTARRECFMSAGGGVSYTYGKGRGVRTYTSIDFTPFVADVMKLVNDEMAYRGFRPMNGCFLNYYEHDRQHLGWHADDFEGMDHKAPVCVVSLGEVRDIWWRLNGEKGEVPLECRQALGHGSLFVMPPGMQHTHQHRIPKGDRKMGPRVSLTFRRFGAQT
jgi:alkylated DNA repair dioxygenase AlkB